MPLSLGFAKTDITPPLAIPYLSFYPRQTPFEGVHDRLYARACTAHNDHEALAIVSVDSLGISRTVSPQHDDFIADLRRMIGQRCGIAPDHIMVCATHAHSTPQTTDIADLVAACPAAEEWLEHLAEQIVETVAAACARRERMVLRGTVAEAKGIGWNRRGVTRDGRLFDGRTRPADTEVAKEHNDHRVPILYARGEHHSGAIIGFTCHPSVVQVQPLVSADYPGVACDLVERASGLAACLFVQGACGDIGAVRRTTNFADVDIYGRILGGIVTSEVARLDVREGRSLPPIEDMSDGLSCAARTVTVDRRPMPPEPQLAEKVAALKAAIAGCDNDDERNQLIGQYRSLAEQLRLTELGQGPVNVEVQALRLGDALFVSAEGELFCEFGNQIKASSPSSVTFVAAYTNGYQGYLTSQEAWDEGGYEVGYGPWTRVGRYGTQEIVTTAEQLAQDVWSLET